MTDDTRMFRIARIFHKLKRHLPLTKDERKIVTIFNRSHKLSKAKIYLKPDEKPPKGLEIKRGPRGGLYYESKVPLPVERAPVPKFKDFPSELSNLTEPRRMYEALYASKSAEDQLKLAYDMWAWYKEHKDDLSSESRQSFNAFHRSINQKIRYELKDEFDKYVGKPKISAKAKKIHDELKSEPHKEVKTASEQFIASIVPERMRVKFAPGQVKDWQENTAELTTRYELHDLASNFKEMSKEKDLRAFLIKSENLLKDLDEIHNSKVVQEMQWRIAFMRRTALNDLDWSEIYYNKIKKDRANEYYTHKAAQSIKITPGENIKVRSETIDEIREMIQETIMNFPLKILQRLDFEHLRIAIIDKGHGYMALSGSVVLIDKSYFPKQGSARNNENSFMRGLLHELTHRYEDTSSRFMEAEKAIFARRTKFCNIGKSRIWGNKYDTYKDRWHDEYMGRLYNSDNFEITSQTISTIFGEYSMKNTYFQDPEMFMFAKESMLDGKFEK